MVGASVIRDMSRMLRAGGLQPRPSLRARLLGQPTIVDVICERESHLVGVPIWPFDLYSLGSAITLKLTASPNSSGSMFSFASGIDEPLISRFTRAVALVAYEIDARDAEAAARGRETLRHALQRATDAVVKACGGAGTAHLWSALGNNSDALPVLL